MAESMKKKIKELRASIKALESQREHLGDEVVNPALAAMQQQLAALQEQAVAPPPAPTEERRMVTILFIDMVGSTAMAEKLDPEDWRQVIKKVHTALDEAVTSHHGLVAQFLGDGLLAFFGARESSELDPENAIRAALAGQESVVKLPALGEERSGDLPEKVQLRCGIHTDLVVVGELGQPAHKEFTASGDAMNLASRLQSAAPPGGILISHDTYRYVRGIFNVTPLPPLTLKGKSEPLQTYLVRSAKPRPFRSLTRGVAGIETRTVGRDAEMICLQDGYLRAFEHHGKVWAQLLGELGVGKSRLLQEMNDWLELRPEDFRLLRARAFPDDANQPFALVRRMWFDRFQIAEDTPLEKAEEKWVERFGELFGSQNCEEPAHALGLLVGLPFQNSLHIKGMRKDPNQIRGRAFVVSRQLMNAIRQQTPLVILLENLQWVDEASWDYLVETVLYPGQVQLNGMFILGAARSDWHPPGELKKLLETSPTDQKDTPISGFQIILAPLTEQATRELVSEIFKRAADVPEQVIDFLVSRSEGMPYYTEEMVNWFIDHSILDTRTPQWRFYPQRLKEQPLPPTLHHLLQTRLGSLDQSERTALQRGAIFGRHFWSGGIEALGVPSGKDILASLQPRGFVERQPQSAFEYETEWSFHHSLLQEVTYESVLKRERAALHKVAADWLEKQARQAGRLEEFAGLLGEHYERAGELGIAAEWYLSAGAAAFKQGATQAARLFYTRSLDLLPPVDKEHRWKALSGRERVLDVLGDAESWKAETTALLELARSMDDDNLLAEACLRKSLYGMRTDSIIISEQAAREALAAARRCGNEADEARALALIAVVSENKGDRVNVIQNIEAALSLARRLEDEEVMSFVLFRAAYCYSGIADTAMALQYQEEQITLDHRLGNRYQEAGGLGNMGSVLLFIGQFKQARLYLERARQINESLDSHRSLAYDLLNLAILYWYNRDLRSALQLYRQALEEITPTRDTKGRIIVLLGLGYVLIDLQDIHGASRAITEANQLAVDHGMLTRLTETVAALAHCALLQGHLEEARRYARQFLVQVQEQGWIGMGDPTLAFLTCAETFDALGDETDRDAVIKYAHSELIKVLETVPSPEWRQAVLENIPHNRALMELWEKRKSN